MDVERLQQLFTEALASDTFTRHGARMGTWDLSRNCSDPVPVTHYSRAYGLVKNWRKPKRGIELVMLTPCRRCPTCLRRHGWVWSQRALAESEASHRTWFVTLTTSPQYDFVVDTVAGGRVDNFGMLSPAKKFALRSRVLGDEVTKYLKRVRKNTGHRLRYLLVTEQHDSEETSPEKRFRPHLHLLVHEFAGQQIAKRQIRENWHHGHSHAKLVGGDWAAWYVTKYISKANDARVRASLKYGSTSSAADFSQGIYTNHVLWT